MLATGIKCAPSIVTLQAPASSALLTVCRGDKKNHGPLNHDQENKARFTHLRRAGYVCHTHMEDYCSGKQDGHHCQLLGCCRHLKVHNGRHGVASEQHRPPRDTSEEAIRAPRPCIPSQMNGKLKPPLIERNHLVPEKWTPPSLLVP